jgi:hypothetical protein
MGAYKESNTCPSKSGVYVGPKKMPIFGARGGGVGISIDSTWLPSSYQVY